MSRRRVDLCGCFRPEMTMSFPPESLQRSVIVRAPEPARIGRRPEAGQPQTHAFVRHLNQETCSAPSERQGRPRSAGMRCDVARQLMKNRKN